MTRFGATQPESEESEGIATAECVFLSCYAISHCRHGNQDPTIQNLGILEIWESRKSGKSGNLGNLGNLGPGTVFWEIWKPRKSWKSGNLGNLGISEIWYGSGAVLGTVRYGLGTVKMFVFTMF